jgi:cell wall-associated NlpC family hydrolase
LASQDHAFPASQERWRLAARLALLEGVRRALGKPYVWGASGPDAFDCSGLVLWLYGRIGVRLPRVAVEQGSVGIAVPDRLRFGDVLLFKRKGPGWHIGLYLARGRFVHAEGRGRGVTISLLRASGYAQRLCRARRYLR